MLEIIRRRRSVRSYLNREVEKEKMHEILKAAMFAPTARNLRPWEFIIVTDNEKKEQLSQATPYAAFAKSAPVVIVICYDLNKGARYKEDCAICAENIYLETVNQGLGTCYIQIVDGTEGDKGNPEAYVKSVLNIPRHFRVQCLMPVGHIDKLPEPHKDNEYDETKIHYETF